VALLRTDVSEERITVMMQAIRPSEASGIPILIRVLQLLVTADDPSSQIRATLMMEAIHPPKHRFLQEPHGVTSQKTARDGLFLC
jgi:hypothetical protein